MAYHANMATAVTETVLTAEEFYQLPDPEQGGKIELVRGRVVTSMPVSGKRGERQGVIWQALRQFLSTSRQGRTTIETGYILRRDPDVVRAPGVSVAPAALLEDGELPEDGFIEGAPLLAVEVVSRTDSEREVLEKVGEYLDAGVARVWVVKARNKTVVVYTASGDVKSVPLAGTLTSDDAGFASSGFTLPVSMIFA